MDYQPLIGFSQRLNDIAAKSHDLFGQEIDGLRNSHGVDTPTSLEQALRLLNEENRLLNIGIVGRVKAGKSSLLNALFFDGRPILPKAATPMTAALTTLTYGSEFGACVEFYSETDLSHIQARAQQYEQRLMAKKSQYYEEFLERRKVLSARNGQPLDVDEVRAHANKRAVDDLQREASLCAAHDQAKRMLESGIAPATLGQEARIEAGGPEELARQLTDYVGAHGRYMPFTKVVNVFMPLEALRDVRVIDTPGMNDPVQSREERTVDLLKTCDVVFIVSPAGQFLSEQDLEVMGRITSKEGVQELVLIASQVDTQLHGSEKRARLDEALGNIRAQLASRAQTTLAGLKHANPEVGAVFDGLMQSVGDNLLHSSGLSHALSLGLDHREAWDSNEQVTWQNLELNYPDYFSLDNPESARRNLDLLANTAAIRNKLAEVRAKKEQITQEKIGTLIASKRRGLDAFRTGLAELAERRIALVQSSDIGQLETLRKSLESKRLKLSQKLDFSYQACMLEYRKTLRNTLDTMADNLLGATSEKIEKAGDINTRQEVREKSGALSWLARKLWDGGKQTVTVTEHSVITGQVASALNKFISDVEHQLSTEASQSRFALDNKLSQALTPEIRRILEDDCDGDMITSAILAVAHGLPSERFTLGICLPDNLKARGTLKGWEAETYKDDASDFLSTLGSNVTRKFDRFIRDIEVNEPKTVSDTFVNDLAGKIALLKEQVSSAAQTNYRLQEFLRQVQEVAP